MLVPYQSFHLHWTGTQWRDFVVHSLGKLLMTSNYMDLQQLVLVLPFRIAGSLYNCMTFCQSVCIEWFCRILEDSDENMITKTKQASEMSRFTTPTFCTCEAKPGLPGLDQSAAVKCDPSTVSQSCNSDKVSC